MPKSLLTVGLVFFHRDVDPYATPRALRSALDEAGTEYGAEVR
jgi:hypothetical protein